MNATTAQSFSYENVSGTAFVELGAHELIEVVYLSTISLMGTLGNLMVISSIVLQKQALKDGNIFLINLAFADLLVTSICLPSIVPSRIKGFNVLPESLCQVVGYLVMVSSVCSLANLTAVAANRYWAIVRHSSYNRVFSKTKSYLMVACTWIWANLFAIPSATSFVGLVYDAVVMVCAWNVYSSRLYNYLLMVIAVFVPVCLTTFFYYQIYKKVKSNGRWIRRVCSTYSAVARKEQRSLQTEIDLLKTLATTVIVFVLCWVPHGLVIMFGRPGPPAQFQKTVAWLALSNSSVNFIIYGVMNEKYRKRYKFLLNYIFCCKSRRARRSSAIDSSERNLNIGKGCGTSTPIDKYPANQQMTVKNNSLQQELAAKLGFCKNS